MVDWWLDIDREKKADALRKESKPVEAIVHLQEMSGRFEKRQKHAQSLKVKCYTDMKCLEGATRHAFKSILQDEFDPQTWMNQGLSAFKFRRFKEAEPFFIKAMQLSKESRDIATVLECRRMILSCRKHQLLEEGGDEDIAVEAAKLLPDMKSVLKEGKNGINFRSKYLMDSSVTGIAVGDELRKKKLKELVRFYNNAKNGKRSGKSGPEIMNYW